MASKISIPTTLLVVSSPTYPYLSLLFKVVQALSSFQTVSTIFVQMTKENNIKVSEK